MDKLFDKVLGADDDDKKPKQQHDVAIGGDMSHGGAYPPAGGFTGGGGPYDSDDDDLNNAAKHAAKHAPDEDVSLFESILGSLASKKKQVAEEDLDEEDAIRSHKQYFTSEVPTPQEPTSSSIGKAAAIQALKMFVSSPSATSNQSHGQSKSAFIGLAMSQASKLFDQQASQGKVAGSGDGKQSAVMKAGEMALKMYLKGQASGNPAGQGVGAGGQGGAGGGVGGLLSMASKFM